jgi:transcriptional regulator with XRE-family HTH domain
MTKTKKPKAKSAAMRFLDDLIGSELTFANMIENIRQTDDYTTASLAKKLGVSRQYLCDVEKGRRIPGLARTAEWGRTLGYSPTQFVRLALQAEIERADLKMRVEVEAA